MSHFRTLIQAYLAAAFAIALSACAAPYGNAGMVAGMTGRGLGPGTMGAQQALLQQQGIGGVGMMGTPFGNAGWQYAGSGFDPAMQPMIAAQQAMNTVYAVSPNAPIFHPMPQPSPTTAVGTAPQAGAPSGYATQAQLRVVAGRVHRNAEETRAALEALRRQRR